MISFNWYKTPFILRVELVRDGLQRGLAIVSEHIKIIEAVGNFSPGFYS